MKLITAIFIFLGSISIAHAAEEFSLKNGVKVILYEKPFDAEKHNIEYCGDGHKFPCKINGGFPFGTDFSLPKTEIIKIEVIAVSEKYELNTSGMYNAFWHQPLEREKVNQFSVRCKDGLNCVVRGFFSDGAGTYVAGWKIVDGKVSRNVLSVDEAVMFPFMETI